MRVEIGKGAVKGTVKAPPSKSWAHRLLLCAALSEGISTVRGVSTSGDILAMLDCISALGAEYSLDGDSVTVQGAGLNGGSGRVYNCRESGNTLRFLIPSALLLGGDAVFCGTERLISRGIGVYGEVFDGRGVSFEIDKDRIKAKGRVAAGEYKIRGNVSSQFISGLLFALPLADGDSTLELIPPVESRSYINITLDALSKFGIEIEELSADKFYIKGNQKYRPSDITVEGDWSNAAFLYALNTVGGSVNVRGVNENSLQGDSVCTVLLKKLENGFAEIDLSDCPDLAPVLFAVAAAGHGGYFTGTARLKIKESDRAAAMAEELAKFGAELEIAENSVRVIPKRFEKPSAPLFGHNDHRVVMSLSVISLLTGAVIEGAEAVNKTYPGFFDDLSSLGAEVKINA